MALVLPCSISPNRNFWPQISSCPFFTGSEAALRISTWPSSLHTIDVEYQYTRRKQTIPKAAACQYLIAMFSNQVVRSLLSKMYSVVTPKMLPSTKGTAQSCHQGASADTA